MNQRIVLSAIALLAGASAIQAQTPAPSAAAAPAATWTLTPAVVSQYMFRGARLGGPSFQPALEYGNGPWIAGIWANVPIKDEVPGQSDPEFDFYGSYTATFSDALSLVPGFTVYTYPDADKSAGFYRATFEPSVALNYTVSGLRLTPKFYYDTVLKGATYEFGAFYAVPLTELGTELDFTATLGTFKWRDALENTSPRAKNWGDYWQAGVALPFQLNASSKLTVGWYYAKGDDNFIKVGTTPKVENGAAVGRGVATISYALTF